MILGADFTTSLQRKHVSAHVAFTFIHAEKAKGLTYVFFAVMLLKACVLYDITFKSLTFWETLLFASVLRADEKTDATLMCAQNDEATGSNQKLAVG